MWKFLLLFCILVFNLRLHALNLVGSNKVVEKINLMNERAKGNIPFNDEEVEGVIRSFKNLNANLDYSRLKDFTINSAHVSFKDNYQESTNIAKELEDIIGSPDNRQFSEIFEHVMLSGRYTEAKNHALQNKQKPWAVLVTGLNGIRKTTTINSLGFDELLRTAMPTATGPLPTGANSFYRQLDYMIATIANSEFQNLYSADNDHYLAYKNAIFSRYRNLAEYLGILLIKNCMSHRMNVLVETSGRDLASFHYMDHFFPASSYNKLVVHFTINDLRYAEKSVDIRMKNEKDAGKRSLSSGSIKQIISSNAGGPYASSQLKKVQEDSDKVLKTVFDDENKLWKEWHKARIYIDGHDGKPWTVRATE